MRSFILIAIGAVAAIAVLVMFGPTSAGSTYIAKGSVRMGDAPSAERMAPFEPGSPWGKHLNPEGLVYEDGFKAFYFDRTQNNASAYQYHSSDVAIKYAWDDLHGLDSDAFSAYWVGVLRFDEAGLRNIDVSLSWSKARIFINGQLIKETSRNESIPHIFEAGEHLLEVEYINNWHTTEFKLTIGSPRAKIGMDEIRAVLNTDQRQLSGIHYVGLYESDSRDTSVIVNLPVDARNAVVWLDSYEAINWRFADPSQVSAIVIASYSPGSQVKNAGQIPVYQAERGYRVTSIGRSGCSCSGAGFRCEGRDDMIGLQSSLQDATGLTLKSFAVGYSEAVVATQPFGDAARQQIESARAAVERKRAQCEAQRNPDFDTMFD